MCSNSTNSSVSASPDPFYHMYHGTGFSPDLVLFYTPTFILVLLGITSNSSVVFVSYKRRSVLNGSFNILIALESLQSTIWHFVHSIPFFLAIFGLNFIPASTCFAFQVLPIFGLNMQNVTMLFISMERFCCIMFPIWFQEQRAFRRKLHLFLVNGLGFSYGLAINIIVYIGIVPEFQTKEVLCYMGDNKSQLSKYINYRVNLCLQAGTLFFYACIWTLMLRAMVKRVQITNMYDMHILKCMSVIMLFIIFGWLLTTLSPFYQPLLMLNKRHTYTFNSLLNNFVQIAASSNAPVLYAFSEEYRKQYQIVFPFLAKWFPLMNANSNAVQVISTNGPLIRQNNPRQI